MKGEGTMKKTICIIHFNTPELTEAAILSVRKHCAEPYDIVVFDNSDKRPFTKKMKGVKVLNNRQQQIVNFDEELAKFPDKCWALAYQSNYGSAKHMMTVQKLWELYPDGFILLESDVLVRTDIGFLWDENFAATGKVQWLHSRNPREISADRLLPFLCYLNVPLLKKHGARYYDPTRCWALMPGGERNPNNRYDTGASLLEDIRNTKPHLWCRNWPDLDKKFFHYNGGSWRQNNEEGQRRWVEQHRKVWEPWPEQDAKIYICTHKDFPRQVWNPVYEVVDARKGGDKVPDGLRGGFYSEILTYQKIAAKKTLPKMVGFCQYRKYFEFMNEVPDLASVGRIVSMKVDLVRSVRDQYATFGNVEDLDLMTSIIDKHYPDFSNAWHNAINGRMLHPCSMFVIPRDDFKRMMSMVTDLLNRWVQTVVDVEKRINDNPNKYHLGERTFDYAYRIGGQLGERIISAWMDWQMPTAKQVAVRTLFDK